MSWEPSEGSFRVRNPIDNPIGYGQGQLNLHQTSGRCYEVFDPVQEMIAGPIYEHVLQKLALLALGRD